MTSDFNVTTPGLDINAVSLALRTARQTNTPQSKFPGPLPETLEEAYAIQMASIAAWPDRVIGWKVGGVAPDFQEKFNGATRIAGPIFEKTVRRQSDEAALTMPAFRDGFAAVEPEWVFELGDVSGIDPETATAEEISGIIKAAYVGIEIASSPMPMVNALGPASIISDFGNNYGLLIGDASADWSVDFLSSVMVTTDIDGRQVGQTTAKHGLDGALGAVKFLIGHLRSHGQMDLDGVLCSSGAITGVHDAVIGAKSLVRFEGFKDLAFELTPISSDVLA